MKKIVVSIALITIASISFFMMPSEESKEIKEKSNSLIKEQSVQIEKVNTISFSNSIKLFSRLSSDNIVDINSQVREVITKIYFKEGDSVSKGDVIAELDYGNLKSHLEYLTKNRTELEIEKKALEKLYKNKQTSRLSIAQIETNIARIDSDIVSTKNNIEKRKIIATINGIIDEINLKEGELSETSVAFVKIIGKVNKVESQAHASLINKMKKGQAVRFINNQLDSSQKGVLTHISKNVSNLNNTIKVEATLENDIQFNQLDGELIIETEELSAMKIPSSSVILADGNKMGIFHVVNEKAKLEKIEIIKNDGNYIWIKPIKGHKTIDLIVVGQFYVKDLMKVVVGEKVI